MESISQKGYSMLGKIQKRATKLVHGREKAPYEQRLKALGLHSLHWRRLRGDLIETYKILTGKENIDSSQLFQRARTTELRGQSLKLYKKKISTRCEKVFFQPKNC